MLNNYIDLVTAVELATRRRLTEHDIDDYEYYMRRYVEGFLRLYSSADGAMLLPYHHISLHLSQFLRGFGPTHGWHCFAYERFNHELQKIKTSGIFGSHQFSETRDNE